MSTKCQIVFVVGCQRSGTTLMGQVIGGHNNAILADETDDIYNWAESVFESSDNQAVNKKIDILKKRAKKKYSSRVQERPDELLVVQAPNLTWAHFDISNNFPSARVIYMVRDIRAVVASMMHLSRVPFVENQIRFFRKAGFIERDFPEEWEALVNKNLAKEVKMALVAKIKMSLAENFELSGIPVMKIKYEDLVMFPEDTVSKVTGFLGIPFDQACLSYSSVLEGFGPGGTDRTRSIDQSSQFKWSDQLSPRLADSIWDFVGGFCEMNGYTR